MTRYVVDTNIWGAFLGKNQKVRTHLRERLVQGHEICVISISQLKNSEPYVEKDFGKSGVPDQPT